MFIAVLASNRSEDIVTVENIVSANNITANGENFSFEDLDTFDPYYSDKNKKLAQPTGFQAYPSVVPTTK